MVYQLDRSCLHIRTSTWYVRQLSHNDDRINPENESKSICIHIWLLRFSRVDVWNIFWERIKKSRKSKECCRIPRLSRVPPRHLHVTPRCYLSSQNLKRAAFRTSSTTTQRRCRKTRHPLSPFRLIRVCLSRRFLSPPWLCLTRESLLLSHTCFY